MADGDVARRLKYIHQTLELMTFLLAILVASSGGIGLVVGASAVVLLVLNVISRSATSYQESIAE